MIKLYKKYYLPFIIICGVLTVFFVFALSIILAKTFFLGIFVGLVVTSIFGGIIFLGLRTLRVRRILSKGRPYIDDFILYDGSEKLILNKEGIQIPFKFSSSTAIRKAKENGFDFILVSWDQIRGWEIRDESHVIETNYLFSIKRTSELKLREKEFVAKVLTEVKCPVKVCTDTFRE